MPQKKIKIEDKFQQGKYNTYTISEDGYISQNMKHPIVRESFEQQMKQIEALTQKGVLIFKQ